MTEAQLTIIQGQIIDIEAHLPKLANKCGLSDNVADTLTARACTERSGLTACQKCSRRGLRDVLNFLNWLIETDENDNYKREAMAVSYANIELAKQAVAQEVVD